MENYFFIFPPNDGYFYSTSKRYQGGKLRTQLKEYLEKSEIEKMLWGAFGPGEENCFFAWLNKEGNTVSCIGDNTSLVLREWLVNNPVDEHVRVTLGPEGSFFIWDSKHIGWHGIPDGLERAIQGWLGPAGWTEGPPRIVTLGTKGSYFALSEYGSVAYSIDDSLKPASKAFGDLKKEAASGTFTYSDLEYVNLSSCDDEHFMYMKKDKSFQGDIPDPMDAFYDCAEDLLDEGVTQAWRAEREARRKDEEQRKIREAREAQETQQAQAKREQRQREADELTLQYVLWQTAWEADLARKKMLTTFPHLPVRVCTCAEISCKLRKAETGLLACQHDVEKFLRASEMYSVAWLRKERLPWHPDRFGQRCDPDFRKDLKRKATEMYAIFETLIKQEMGEDDA